MTNFHKLVSSLSDEYNRLLDENACLKSEILQLRGEHHASLPEVEGTAPDALIRDEQQTQPAARCHLVCPAALPGPQLLAEPFDPDEAAPGESKLDGGTPYTSSSDQKCMAIDYTRRSSFTFRASSKESFAYFRCGRVQKFEYLTVEAAGCGKHVSRWLINPEDSRFLRHWDMVTLVAMIFVSIVTPIQVGMMETRLDALFIINSLVDGVFLVDFILQFFLMYPYKTVYGGFQESNHGRIIRHYLRTWCAIDLVSIMPFDAASLAYGSAEFQKMKAVKTVRLLRLLKLARVLRACRVFYRLEVRVSITYQRMALAKFFTALALITHWMACIWALTLVLVDEGEGVPRWVDALSDMEADVEVKTRDSMWKLYVTCLYFTGYTITSVGYGDIGPQNILERVVCTLMIFVSGVSWAMVLGQVCGIVGNMDSGEQDFRSMMDEVNRMMEDRALPMELRQSIRGFFLSSRATERQARYKALLSQLSPGLRGLVNMQMQKSWIVKVGFLGDFVLGSAMTLEAPLFIGDLAQRLQIAKYSQGEAFGVLQTLYILNRGLVHRVERVVQSGDIWGCDFILSDLDLLEPYDCLALTFVEVMALDRASFMEVVDMHEREWPDLKIHIRRCVVRLAAKRGIMREAAQRKKMQNSLVSGKMLRDRNWDPVEFQDPVSAGFGEQQMAES
eukprot:CAMPEP_0117475068 /NCGR_PEP_ID=MMETSP0784-20121206/9605_1 /TAXON_ID=39447 /ORGANISM="" /LENGTH=674 /DNA_ID=CAMNT_0005269305 /DNA_START=56 /DNA_END=2080 /DNA_ORIENTATION=+